MSKIPKQAKKVFSGEIFDVYQWPQKMYDGSTANFEMIKRANTALIIPILEDKILMIEEQQPGKKYDHTLVGGRQEKNETILACAKREFLEETGLTGKLIFCGVNHKTDFSKQGELLEDKIFFVFKATNLKGSFVEQFQGGKNIWLSLAQIKKLDKLFPDVLDKIKLLEGKREFFSEKQYFVDEF